MEVLYQVIQVSLLFVPFFITLVVEVLKGIESVPVNSENAKWVALGLSVVWVALTSYQNFDASNALLYAGQIVANYGLAVGFYETLKNYLKK